MYHDLTMCTHALFRCDLGKKTFTTALKVLLRRPSHGPFKVLEHALKTMTLDVDGEQQIITVHRIKPAFIDSQATASAFSSSPSRARTGSESQRKATL